MYESVFCDTYFLVNFTNKAIWFLQMKFWENWMFFLKIIKIFCDIFFGFIDKISRFFTMFAIPSSFIFDSRARVWYMSLLGQFSSFFFFNWGSLLAMLNSHYKAWNYKKKKDKKIKAYKKSV